MSNTETWSDRPIPLPTSTAAGNIGTVRRETIVQIIERERMNLQQRLTEITQTLDIIREHPELQRAIEVIYKYGLLDE